MAYISQENKSVIVDAVKKVLPKNWKASFKVLHNSTLVMTIRQMPKQDLLDIAYKDVSAYREIQAFGDISPRAIFVDDFKNSTEFHRELYIAAGCPESSFERSKYMLNITSEKAKIIENIIKALNVLNYNESDPMTDYFNVGYYVDLKFGQWDKPCKLV